MEHSTCPVCGSEGGIFVLVGERYIHRKCLNAPVTRDDAKSTFPFFAQHMAPGGVMVESMRHLRKLENQHGVQSVAYNQNSQNFDH